MAVGKANQRLKLSSFSMGNQSYLYIDSILGIIYMMVSTDLVVLHGHTCQVFDTRTFQKFDMNWCLFWGIYMICWPNHSVA